MQYPHHKDHPPSYFFYFSLLIKIMCISLSNTFLNEFKQVTYGIMNFLTS